MDYDLPNPTFKDEQKDRLEKLKRIFPDPKHYSMGIKCQGCNSIVTLYSHYDQPNITCQGCNKILYGPCNCQACFHARLAAEREKRKNDERNKPKSYTMEELKKIQSLQSKMDYNLSNPTFEDEQRKNELKRLVQGSNSYFVDARCPGCNSTVTLHSHYDQPNITCQGCNRILYGPCNCQRCREARLAANSKNEREKQKNDETSKPKSDPMEKRGGSFSKLTKRHL